MRLFGKKQKDGVKQEDQKKKKPISIEKRRALERKKLLKFKRPKDVKLFYQMPIYFIVGIFLILTGYIWIQKNGADYKASVLAQSMKFNEQLPLWGGTAKGNLTLGHTKLSKDGKTLAVEIKYDTAAHQGLSSYGSRYKLRLVDTKDNQMKDAKMSYGIFGTDGSGVLQIKSPSGFKNHSFIVMLIDNGQLVTTEDLSSETQMTDTDLDKSITAELSDANNDPNSTNNDSSNDSSKKKNLPPLYYVRLNAHNAAKNYRNWNNDSEMVEDLFVKDNLVKLKESMMQSKLKLKRANKTLKEMNNRLAENKNDATALQNKTDLESSITALSNDYKATQKRYTKLKNATIEDDILKPKQTKYHTYTIENINAMN